ncbi:hypothetical protein, partial [Halorubrum sp. SS7]|uniref:hypothetical protein n=1 Tax=Halorubrum sp. SS7 TaxID=2518119 RepID=UPI001A7E0B0D
DTGDARDRRDRADELKDHAEEDHPDAYGETSGTERSVGPPDRAVKEGAACPTCGREGVKKSG